MHITLNVSTLKTVRKCHSWSVYKIRRFEFAFKRKALSTRKKHLAKNKNKN